MYIYRRILAVTVICLLALAGCGGGGGGNSNPTSQPLYISFLAVGQGDATYIKMPDGRCVLIDGGTRDDCVQELARLGAGPRIDLIISTHHDIDHVGGLFEVIDRYEVGEVWETGASVLVISKQWREALDRHHIPTRLVKAGDYADFGDVRLRVLAPERTFSGEIIANPNRYSLVCQLERGAYKALFLSDATIDEQQTFASELGPVDIMKVAHHGAADAAWEETYQRTTPKVAVLTLGSTSQFVGLPSPQAMALINQYAGEVHRTYPDGTITYSSR